MFFSISTQNLHKGSSVRCSINDSQCLVRTPMTTLRVATINIKDKRPLICRAFFDVSKEVQSFLYPQFLILTLRTKEETPSAGSAFIKVAYELDHLRFLFLYGWHTILNYFRLKQCFVIFKFCSFVY